MANKPKKLLFKLILIGLLTIANGCGDNDESSDEDSEQDSATEVDTNTDTGDTGPDTETDMDTDYDGGSPVDAGVCDEWESTEIHEVPSPPSGLPAELAELCAEDVNPLAVSNRAARVTLNVYSANLYLATGHIALAEELKGRVVGLPSFEVTEAVPEDLVQVTVSGMAAVDDGFSFNLEFSQSGWFNPGETEITVKVIFEILCGDASGETQMVESTTYLHLCDDVEHPQWISSGGECVICHEVCEMVACPLPVDNEQQIGALSGSPNASIVPVARFGRSLLLFAETRHTKGKLSYHWQASGGKIEGGQTAGVIWEVPPESTSHLIQVAIRDDKDAVVASMRFKHRV